MRPGRVILVFALAVFLGGALLAPWLYELAQWGAAHHFAAALARNPFHRFVNRSLLVLALLGIWPLMRALGMCSWKNLGWVKPCGQGARLASGFAVGFASLALLAAVALVGGGWAFLTDLSASHLAAKLLGATLSAAVVAVLEETFFRGAVMGALRRAHAVPVAILLSSAIYALLHFFQRPEAPAEVHWFTGLALLPQMMRGFVDGPALVPGFFNLMLAGVLLAMAYQRTGNLYFSMGLHGGWVFWLKFCSAVAVARPGANVWLWGTPGRLIDGWLALAVLGAVVLGAVVLVMRRLRWAEVTRDEHGMDSTG